MASRPPAVDPNAPLPPHLDPRAGRHGRSSRFPAYQLVGRSLGVILSVGLLLLAGYFWYTYRTINAGVTRLPVHVGHAPTGKDDIDGKDQNILLVGNDDRSNMTDAEVRLLKVGRDGGSQNTDTMMIVHVPADGSKATLISLPRDAYVKIPGHGMSKLNAAYVFGYHAAHGTPDQKRTAGADLLIQTIQNLTGLTVNHYVQVSLMGFYDISNAIGGVQVNLCHAVDDTVAYNRSIGSDGGSGFKMSAGKHTVKGVQALEFVRQRHNLPLGDIDRVRRQQYFLTAAFRKVASVGILLKLRALGDAVKRNVYMDPGLDLIGLAHQMENLQADNIVGKTIPFEGFNHDSPVGDVEVINPAHVQQFVQRLIEGKGTGKKPHKHHSSSPSGSKPLDSKCIN
jgi:LCP family protein required for cell wall assembly